jgi:hypothetical protein
LCFCIYICINFCFSIFFASNSVSVIYSDGIDVKYPLLFNSVSVINSVGIDVKYPFAFNSVSVINSATIDVKYPFKSICVFV